jgi:thiamine biosynthesis lipoprotein
MAVRGSNSSSSALLSVARRHMATDFEFEVVVVPAQSRIAESVLAEAHLLVAAIENSLSEYRESALVYRLNHSSPGEWIPCDVFFAEILEISARFSRESEGAFTPFVRSTPPANFSDLEIDRAGSRVRRKRGSVQVGFGAVGKGYALDRVASLLDRQGFTDYRLGAGGSSWVFRGFAANHEPWVIAWGWSRDAAGDFAGHRYELPGGRPIAIGVSGTVEQGQHFLWEGSPLRVTLQSAFCSGRTAAEADAFSTALMVGASREGEEFLTKLPHSGIHALCLAYVDLENQMIYNQGFDTLFLRARTDTVK